MDRALVASALGFKKVQSDEPHHINFELSTTKTDTLDNFLHFDHETSVKHGTSKLNMSKMSRTLRHAFLTGLTFEVAVDGCGWVSDGL